MFVADGSDADDLKDAIVAELRLDAAPNRVRLLLEVGTGGAPVPLDSRKALAGQGVLEGSSVVVEVLALEVPSLVNSSPLPPPLAFAQEMVCGEPVFVADLQGSPGFSAPYPFFLSPTQLAQLMNFLTREPLFDSPSMLMISGTIKSGKTRIVSDITPRLLSLLFSQAPAALRRRPVIFHHLFTLGEPAAAASERLLRGLLSFSNSLGIAAKKPEDPATFCLASTARALAKRVHEDGGQLWLLLDELGAPVVASTPGEARAFIQLFKDTLSAISPFARTVATGSGMVSLLKGVMDSAVNGYVLWEACRMFVWGRSRAPPWRLPWRSACTAPILPFGPLALEST